MNIVIKMSTAEIAKVVANFQPWAHISHSAYIQFLAKPVGCVITVYTSGKVMFQGEQAETYAAKFGYQNKPENATTIGQTNLIGTDEVGNGSYFGGLAVVATYLTETDLPLIHSLGVADSKRLSDHKIREIAPILKEKIQHRALLLSPSKYNDLMMGSYNAVSVKVALHNQAIYLLEATLSAIPDHIIIDAFTSDKNYRKYLKQEKNQTKGNVTLCQKAESQFYAVAVSSIIARALFLDNLADLSQELHVQLPSGASHESDIVAAQIIKEYGASTLGQVAKLHFANTEKARKLAE